MCGGVKVCKLIIIYFSKKACKQTGILLCVYQVIVSINKNIRKEKLSLDEGTNDVRNFVRD